jgi:snurportin-1
MMNFVCISFHLQRRENQIESSRLESLALLNLTLGDSDDEEEQPEVVREGLSGFATMLGSRPGRETASTNSQESLAMSVTSDHKSSSGKKKKKGKGKKIPGRGSASSSSSTSSKKWAEKCMYAELLEMLDDEMVISDGPLHDGLPDDIETGWVAVAPVPRGKRCLAISYQSSGLGQQCMFILSLSSLSIY